MIARLTATTHTGDVSNNNLTNVYNTNTDNSSTYASINVINSSKYLTYKGFDSNIIPSNSKINSVTAKFKAKAGNPNLWPMFKITLLSGGTIKGTGKNFTLTTNSAIYTHSDVGEWTLDELSKAEFKFDVQCTSVAGNSVSLYGLELVVDYDLCKKAVPSTHTTPFVTTNKVTGATASGYQISQGYSDENYNKDSNSEFANLYTSASGENDILYHGFDVSSIPEDATILGGNMVFGLGLFDNGDFKVGIYSGNVLLTENSYTPNAGMSIYEVDLTDMLTYENIQNIGIDISFTSTAGNKLFRFSGASLNIIYKSSGTVSSILAKIGPIDISKMYIGISETVSAYVGTTKILG